MHMRYISWCFGHDGDNQKSQDIVVLDLRIHQKLNQAVCPCKHFLLLRVGKVSNLNECPIFEFMVGISTANTSSLLMTLFVLLRFFFVSYHENQIIGLLDLVLMSNKRTLTKIVKQTSKNRTQKIIRNISDYLNLFLLSNQSIYKKLFHFSWHDIY